MKKTLIIVAAILGATNIHAQRIDFNYPGRSDNEVNEPDYTPWALATTASDTKQITDGKGNAITVTIANDENYAGKTLRACWFKNGISSTKLVADGFAIYGLEADNNTPQVTSGAVRLNITISGLPAGEHSLLAYHNNTDNYSSPKLDVYVDGEKKLSGVKQTVRATSMEESGASYVRFAAQEGKDVTISYITTPSADDSRDGYYNTSLTVNALVFDSSNPSATATSPYPSNRNYHADADGGSIKLTWTPSATAVKHHVLVGTAADELAEQTVTTAPEYTLDNPSNLNTYYWRIDEEDANGETSQGETWSFRPRHLAFPGAEGWGRYAIGGRGGMVYHVTTLEDNGDDENPIEGSFRYGIKKLAGPRTIVFDVGGVIALKKRLMCGDQYVTIAGQTAPGNGIMLRNCPFGMTSEGITRFMRMRLGHKEMKNGVITDEASANGLDGMGMAGCDNAIMDHCSISWTIDEAFSSRGAKSLTLQRTLISEALNIAGHPNYSSGKAHGFAATIGGGEMSSELKVGSYHHNLLAHNNGRNWSLSGGLDGVGAYDGHHDVFNNVVYNWGSRATDGGSHEINFVGNYYKMGPSTSQSTLLNLQLEGTGTGTQSAYVSGNIRQAKDNGSIQEDKKGTTYKYSLSGGQKLDWTPFVDKPFFESLATVETARAAYKNVLSDVGANQPFLDNHDERMISETIQGTYSAKGSRSGKKGLIDSEEDSGCEGFDGLNIYEARRNADWDTDQDGMPDWWEEANGVSSPNEDADGNGYTNLEDYLNWMAEPHFFLKRGESVVVDMKKYFAGYTNKPSFSISSIQGGSVEYRKGTTDGEFVFTAAESNRQPLASFSVTATDADKISNYTRHFNFFVDGVTTGVNELRDEQHADSYTLYNIEGKMIGKSRNTENLPSGVYILKAYKDGKQVSVRKILIPHS